MHGNMNVMPFVFNIVVLRDVSIVPELASHDHQATLSFSINKI